MKSIKFLLAVAALSVSGLAAAGPRDVNSVVVRYADLNLNTQAGIARLYSRIVNAAESVCGPLDMRILGLREAYDECVATAASEGIAAVGNPSLTRYYESKGRTLVVASNQ